GHPLLGADVGGTLAMVPAAAVLAYGIFGQRRMRLAHLPLLALGGLALAGLFAAIDLSRPPQSRSHLGDFLVTVAADPEGALVLLRRKAGLVLSPRLSSPWFLAVPTAAAVLVTLHRRSEPWRQLLARRRGLRSGLKALIVAAVAGSLLNDSGLSVAAVMLALGAPWALLVASEARRPHRQAAEEQPSVSTALLDRASWARRSGS
ncbi:MAG: hypothetical protein ACRD0D_10340, partial [Acidimicrobiales bacterium]